MSEYSELLDSLLKEVREDDECKKLVDDLRSYALYAVTKNENDIKDTISNRAKVGKWPVNEDGALEIDILWPGAGYNSVACGGSFEVLAVLENMGVLKIRDFMGASGGAASAILTLADENGSSRTLLEHYMVYAKWASRTPRSNVRQLWKATPLWAAIYRQVIQDDSAFQRVRERGYVAVAGGKTFQNWILHNFTDREQCVQAYEASGEASLTGMFIGNKINGLESRLGRCSDGGAITNFPGRKRPLVYHHTFYGYASTCTLKSIELLFRKGVDEAIAMFCDSYDVCKHRNSEYGGIIMTTGEDLSWEGISGLRSHGRFLNVEKGEEVTELP